MQDHEIIELASKVVSVLREHTDPSTDREYSLAALRIAEQLYTTSEANCSSDLLIERSLLKVQQSREVAR